MRYNQVQDKFVRRVLLSSLTLMIILKVFETVQGDEAELWSSAHNLMSQPRYKQESNGRVS